MCVHMYSIIKEKKEKKKKKKKKKPLLSRYDKHTNKAMKRQIKAVRASYFSYKVMLYTVSRSQALFPFFYCLCIYVRRLLERERKTAGKKKKKKKKKGDRSRVRFAP